MNWTAKKVRALRRRPKGDLLQRELAEVIGVSRRTIIRWEKNGVPIQNQNAREKLDRVARTGVRVRRYRRFA